MRNRHRTADWRGQYGLQLTAHTVIVDRGREHQHIGIVHSGNDVYGIIIDHTVTELDATEAALAETNLLFTQIHRLYQVSRLLRASRKDAASVSELPPLRGLEEMINTLFFIVLDSLHSDFSLCL